MTYMDFEEPDLGGGGERSDADRFLFNGVDGRTGEPLFNPMRVRDLLPSLSANPKPRQRRVATGVNPRDLSQAGWGVIFHQDEDSEVIEALRPLLKHREAQAARHLKRLYREDLDYRSGETKEDFLCRHGAVIGRARPQAMPYYLLIVGEPGRIPFDFQHQLDFQYAVGRICFDTPEEYEHYAKSVVASEAGGVRRSRRLDLFGTRDDETTTQMAKHLIVDLGERLRVPEPWQVARDWKIECSVGGAATKERLRTLVEEEQGPPALVFTATHGSRFVSGDAMQRDYQGSLVCQKTGEGAMQKVPPEHYFAAGDVSDRANVSGLITFHFACHSAGTPAFEDFAFRKDGPPEELAPQPFVARLPQRLLSHPRGGALAVIGHVERAWMYSFLSQEMTAQVGAFETAFRLLMEGAPVGFAMEEFDEQCGEMAVHFAAALERADFNGKPGEDLKQYWTAVNDSRNYTIIGDPAVRAAVG